MNPSSPPRPVRRAVGGLFVATGTLKMLIWPRFFAFCGSMAPQVLAGTIWLAPARAALLATALAVPPLEVVAGIALWRGRKIRLTAALLALDMLGAIVTVGVPGRLGKSTEISGHKIGAEPWRLPLEVVLLLACAWMAARANEPDAAPRG